MSVIGKQLARKALKEIPGSIPQRFVSRIFSTASTKSPRDAQYVYYINIDIYLLEHHCTAVLSQLLTRTAAQNL